MVGTEGVGEAEGEGDVTLGLGEEGDGDDGMGGEGLGEEGLGEEGLGEEGLGEEGLGEEGRGDEGLGELGDGEAPPGDVPGSNIVEGRCSSSRLQLLSAASTISCAHCMEARSSGSKQNWRFGQQ